MQRKTRYVGKRIDSYTFSRGEVIRLLEEEGNLQGLTPRPNIETQIDGSVTLTYVYHLEEKPYGD